MNKKTIRFTETALQEAAQAMLAGRLPIERIEPILADMDAAGFYSISCWGGASFETCVRYLKEDPWERLRILRDKLSNTKLQMTLAGQCLLSDHPFHDGVVRHFVRLAAKNGIDVFNVYDPLNNLENMKAAIDEALECGAKACGVLSYVDYPGKTVERFVELSAALREVGAAAVCLRDRAGCLTPQKTFELVSTIKREIDAPVILHSSCKSGMAFMSYLKAVEAGVDAVETAISPLSGGSSLPATETVAFALNEYGYKVQLDNNHILNIASFFKSLRNDIMAGATFNDTALATDMASMDYQLPGDFLGILSRQLKILNCEKRMDDVLRETDAIRKEMGYPALVPPIDQIVATQAVQNVLANSRYRNVGADMKLYARGAFGDPPELCDEPSRKKILQNEEPFAMRYSDTLSAHSYEKAQAEAGNRVKTEEDVFTYMMFPSYSAKTAKKSAEERPKKKSVSLPFSIEKI